MRIVILVGLLAALAGGRLFAAAPEATLILSQNGRPAATIVIAKEPTRAAQFAACELRWHLKQITGGDFLIARDDEPVKGLAILVGDGKLARAMGIKPEQLKRQEYLIHSTPQALALVGRDKDDRGIVQYDQTPDQQTLDTWPGLWDEQGTMYAVYDFLECYCNVRSVQPHRVWNRLPATGDADHQRRRTAATAFHEVPLCGLPHE